MHDTKPKEIVLDSQIRDYENSLKKLGKISIKGKEGF